LHIRNEQKTVNVIMDMPRAFYADGGITIFHADCRDVLPLLPAESVDFICTDSPYGVSFRGRFDNKHAVIVGDDELSWVEPVFAEVFRVMKRDTLAVCFYGWPHAEAFIAAWKHIGFRLVSHLCFVKNVPGLGHFTRSGHETAFLLAKGQPRPPAVAIPDTIDWQREQDGFHPNQKPLAAITRVVGAFAPEQGLVLDPFLGSGTTLRAAKDLGLQGIGVEIEETYCVRASQRMAQGVLPFLRRKPATPVEVDLFRG
jgi:site-specific DNA-methyltransferase (adenine-specific)